MNSLTRSWEARCELAYLAENDLSGDHARFETLNFAGSVAFPSRSAKRPT